MISRLHGDSRSVASILVKATLALLVCSATATADDPTTYKIRNRWLSTQFLTDRNGTVAYGTDDDATSLWTLEDAGPLRRIRNVGTSAYISLEAGSAAVITSKAIPTTPAGLWEVEVGVFPFRWVKNGANGKYLNCERRLGHVECDVTSLPSGDNLWSGQWELVHAGGPPPPPYFRRNQVAVTTPPYASTIKGETTVELRTRG